MGAETPFARLTSCTSTTSTTRSTRIKKSTFAGAFFFIHRSLSAAVLLKEREVYIAIFAFFHEVRMFTEVVVLGVF